MNTTDNITATIDPPAAHALVAHQGEPWWFGDNLFEFLVPSDSTGGQISVFRFRAPGGFGPPRHVHTREDEVFHVLDGEVCFEIDGRRLLGGPGTTVWMPRGVPHGFRIQSATATMLGIITPGSYEHLFRALGSPARARALPPAEAVQLDVPALIAEMTARGTRVVGPPISAEEAAR
jgi:quercetin dioxygenase-like cupin family protein